MASSRKSLAASAVLLSVLLFGSCHKATNSGTQAANTDNSQAANNPSTAQGGSANNAQATNPPSPPPVTISAGTELVVRLADSLSSARNRRGDTFLATLEEPVVVDGYVVAREDSKLTGRVVAARESGHLRTPARLAITLTYMELDGQSYPIETTDYARRARGHAKHNAKWIGALAGGGALLGALVGHGKGALIGAGIGAGAGTGTAYATGKKDIYFPSESRLRFRLERPVTVYFTG
jgi:hypothetical protein